MIQHTTSGIHKDDIHLLKEGQPIQKIWKSRTTENFSSCYEISAI